VPITGAAEPSGRRLREVSSITAAPLFLAEMPAAVPSGNSPSSTMPSTLAASARSICRPSPPGVTTASATTPRARAAAPARALAISAAGS